ncbi:MAG: type I methionyl aminopeptidase [Candidatus Levybacteria bacterium]|nr:type I methionyl aminopeptidase [Candidatus Levybacteria bacterium]
MTLGNPLVKTKEEIEIMRQGGKILAYVLSELANYIKPDISELDIDRLAEKLILEKGAVPGFKKVDGYKHATCISTNDVVVHGIPTEYRLKEGDIVGIDCGVYYKGFHTDMAQTLRVSTQNYNKIDKFLETGEKAMWEGIKAAKLGNRIGDISKAIQDVVEGQRYSVVRSLIGHGVGKELHEEPEVPGFLDQAISRTPKLYDGMTIAVEVIYNMGKSDVIYSINDGWTIKSKDGSLSGLFERTIAITREGPLILTK